MTISEAASSDFFFRCQDLEIGLQVEADILAMLVEPKRHLFYNRAYGAGVEAHENAPSGLTRELLLAYEVVSAFAIRNGRVTDGSNGPDRRALSSQSVIEVRTLPNGNIDVAVGYIAYTDSGKLRGVSVPLGG